MLNFTNSCYLKVENNIYMTKNAIAWIREDFRIEHNPALSYATQNHENVIALFIYNKADFDHKREAQKWWLFKSLEIGLKNPNRSIGRLSRALRLSITTIL